MFNRICQTLRYRYSTLRLWLRKRCSRRVTRRILGSHNRISYAQAALSSVTFDIQGHDNVITIHPGCILNNVVFYVRGSHHAIEIGPDCSFTQGGELYVDAQHGALSIGARSTFENAHLAVTEPHSRLTIGEDCMFAYDIDVRTGDSHSILSQDTHERLNPARDVTIGNHVWVAAHCIILKGVLIAEDSVVATGSVVTKRFDTKGILIGGNPAKVLKESITWCRERIEGKS